MISTKYAKILIITLLFAAAVGLAALIYQLRAEMGKYDAVTGGINPKLDDSQYKDQAVKDWGVYRNTELGYTLSYPKGWSLDTSGLSTSLTKEVRVQAPEYEEGETFFAISLDTRGFKTATDIKAVYDKLERESLANYKFAMENTVVGGLPAYAFLRSDLPNSREVYVIKNGKTYLLTTFRYHLPAVRQMFEKFQFASFTDSQTKEGIAKLFTHIAQWEVRDPSTNIQIRPCANGQAHDIKLPVYELFFEANQDERGAYVTSEVTSRIPKIQEILEKNGWENCSGEDEPGFYQQNTYVKNGKLLGLNWGTRDAVLGGTYITIQFEYIQERNDWQLYTNNRTDYQFEYPATGNLSRLEEVIKYPRAIDIHSKDIDLVRFGDGISITYSVQTRVGQLNTTLEEWIKSNLNLDSNLDNYKKITVGGEIAYTHKKELLTYIGHNRNVYVLSYGGHYSTMKLDNPIYKHLLDSFRFTFTK